MRCGARNLSSLLALSNCLEPLWRFFILVMDAVLRHD